MSEPATVTILHKRSTTIDAAPQTTDLVAGEIAVNLADRTWFTKTTNGEVVCLNQIIALDGGEITI